MLRYTEVPLAIECEDPEQCPTVTIPTALLYGVSKAIRKREAEIEQAYAPVEGEPEKVAERRETEAAYARAEALFMYGVVAIGGNCALAHPALPVSPEWPDDLWSPKRRQLLDFLPNAEIVRIAGLVADGFGLDDEEEGN